MSSIGRLLSRSPATTPPTACLIPIIHHPPATINLFPMASLTPECRSTAGPRTCNWSPFPGGAAPSLRAPLPIRHCFCTRPDRPTCNARRLSRSGCVLSLGLLPLWVRWLPFCCSNSVWAWRSGVWFPASLSGPRLCRQIPPTSLHM